MVKLLGLRTPNGSVRDDARWRLLAASYEPSDEQSRKQLLYIFVSDAERSARQGVASPSSLHQEILRAKSRSQKARNSVLRVAQDLVGQGLSTQAPVKNRARQTVDGANNPAKLLTADRSLMRAWREYAPVAHIIAGYADVLSDLGDEDWSDLDTLKWIAASIVYEIGLNHRIEIEGRFSILAETPKEVSRVPIDPRLQTKSMRSKVGTAEEASDLARSIRDFTIRGMRRSAD